MHIPSETDVDAAVPPDGIPHRGKANKVLKDICAAITYLPESGSIPKRSEENENFTGGRIKANMGTDPDDCVTVLQMELAVSAVTYGDATDTEKGLMSASDKKKLNELFSFAGSAPLLPTSAGTQGQMFCDSDAIYICVATNTWRMIGLSGWE